MCSLTGDAAVINYNDPVSVLDRTNPLGNNQFCHSGCLFLQCTAQCTVCTIVQG